LRASFLLLSPSRWITGEKYWSDLFCAAVQGFVETDDAIWPLLKIDEYLVNPE